MANHILFFEEYTDELKKVADDLGLTAIEPGAYTLVKMGSKVDGSAMGPEFTRRTQPDIGLALLSLITGHPFVRMYEMGADGSSGGAAVLFFQGVRFSETYRTSQIIDFNKAIGGYEFETVNSFYRMFKIDPMGRFGRYLKEID